MHSTKKKIIFAVVTLLVTWYIFCLPRNLFEVPYSTVVVDQDNVLLGARIADDMQWRFPVTDTIPEKFKQCLIIFEDQYFYYHWGVNPLAIGRAAMQNIKAKQILSGGSTISMQTIRLSRKKDRVFIEKIIEMILSTRLEFRCSKEQILGIYASHAPFGGNVVGLEAAAWRYFGHPANNLSWAEAATLAILPNAPAMIHLAKNRTELLTKRNRLLKKLSDKGIIDQSTYELAITEPLPEAPLPLPQIAPHLVDYFHQHAKGNYCRATINKGIQQQTESILDRWNSELKQSDIRNIAALIINVKKNQVVAYCGNANYTGDQSSSNQVDIIRAPRSTGSILKPFLYCAMLQDGELLPSILIPDIPININGFTPENFDRQFNGAVPASQALARSLNIPAVYELKTYGIPKFYDFLKKNKFTTINKLPDHYGLSLILGGAEATLWDVTATFNNMARVLNKELKRNEMIRGRPQLLLNSKEKDELKIPQLFNAGAVWQTFEALKEVNRPEEIDWQHIPSMQTIAWKTGTSYGFRDAWAVGATSDYVVGVWVGNANGEGKPGLIGAKTAGPVLFDIFNVLPSSPWFSIPYHELVEAEVCRESGHIKGMYCENTDTVFICPNGLKTSACPYHVSINLTTSEQYRVYEDCAGTDGIKQVAWFILPPAWEWYYKQQHPDYRNLPPFKPGCGPNGQIQCMQFIYPQKNARISLPIQLDGNQGKAIFEVAHTNPNALVFWHLDQHYLGQTESFHQMALSPSQGKHSVTVVDNEGNSLSITFIAL